MPAFTPLKRSTKFIIFVIFQEFLFDEEALCDGNLPNDRVCHGCQRYGHFIKNCPRLKNNKPLKENDKNRFVSTIFFVTVFSAVTTVIAALSKPSVRDWCFAIIKCRWHERSPKVRKLK